MIGINRQGAEQQRMPFSLEIKNAVEIPQEVNQHKRIIHLRFLKIINDTASRNNSSVVSNV